MSFRMFLIAILLVAGAVTGCATAPGTSMGGHPVYGYSGYSSGGALYVNAFPSFAEVSLDANRSAWPTISRPRWWMPVPACTRSP